jgi:hypothetical protein
MTTVYIVTSGEYSDYGIRAVFSTPELAQRYAKVIRDGEIEEWSLDEMVDAEMRTIYGAYVEKDGTLNPRNSFKTIESSRHTDSFVHMDGTCCAWSAVSQEHADKLAIELWQQQQVKQC